MRERFKYFRIGDTVLVKRPNYYHDHGFIFEGVISSEYDRLFHIKLLKPDGTIESYLAREEEIIVRVS